jgi:hypothetical protein
MSVTSDASVLAQPAVTLLPAGAHQTVSGRLIYNVHERRLDVPIAIAGPLIDLMSHPDNSIWPTPLAGSQVFDGAFKVGANGGHGGGIISYTIVEYRSGHRIMFRFNDVHGFEGQILGIHFVEVVAAGLDECLVRYILIAEMEHDLRAYWIKTLGQMHDQAVELLFDNVEKALLTLRESSSGQ